MSGNAVKLGDRVVVKVDPRENNGSDEAAATVVRVLDVEDGTRVNVKAHLDGDVDRLMRNVPVLSASDSKKDDAPKVHARRS